MSLRQNWRNNIPSPIRQSLKRPLRGGRLSEFGSAALRATLAAAVLTGAIIVPSVSEAGFVVTDKLQNSNWDDVIFKWGSIGGSEEVGKQAESSPTFWNAKSIYLNPRDGDVSSYVVGATYNVMVGYGSKVDDINDTNKEYISYATALGHDTNAGYGAVAVGSGAKAKGYQSVVIGAGASADRYLTGTKIWSDDAMARSVVIGAGSSVSMNPYNIYGSDVKNWAGGGQGTVVGSSSIATMQATAVGNDVYAIGKSSIAIGNDDTSAYRNLITQYDFDNYFKKLYTGLDPSGQKYGYGTNPNTDNRIYSPTLAQGTGSIAIGSRSLANDEGATALGTLAFALKRGSTAVGTETRAEGAGALAFGNNTYVLADNAIAVGSKTQVRSEGGTAYGYKAYAGNTNSMAIGRDVYANIAVTTDAQVYGTYGLYNLDPAKGAKSILDDKPLNDDEVELTTLGSGGTLPAYIDTSKTYLENLENAFVAPESSTAAGGLKYATATYDTDESTHGVTTLLKPKANAKNAIVIGSKSIGQGSNDIVIGRGAIATDDNSFAIGSYAMSLDSNSMAIGLASRATKKNSIAVGTAASVMGENSLSVGTGTINYGSNSTVVGSRSGIGLGTQNSIVLGSSGFIGLGIQNSMAIGSEASIGGYVQDPTNNFFYKINPNTGEKTGERIQLMGQMTADTNLRNAMAIGNKARVYAKNTTAAESGYAAENGVNAMAIGNEAHAWLENSMALGYQSRTDYTPEQLATEAWRTPDAIAVSTTSKVGVISVGSVGNERRIVNLAAGAYDTDAVNVSQLKQMYDTIQRQMGGTDEESGLHYVSTNFVPASEGSNRVDYVAKNRIQNAYSRYVSTLKDYRSYMLKQAYGGAELTQTAKDSFNKELTRLEKILTADGTGITTDKLDNLKLNSVGHGTLTRVNGEVTGLTIDTIPTGTVTNAINTLETQAKNDLAVLTTDGNEITGLTSTAIAEGLHNINYTNELAEATGSVAIGYTAHVATGGTSGVAIGANSGVTARGGVAIGEGASVTSQNGVAIGRQASVTKSDTDNASTVGISYGGHNTTNITTPGAIFSVGGDVVTNAGSVVKEDGFTRRITHVAAGLQPTDAVNVAQLDSLAKQEVSLKGNTGEVKSALGDTTKADYIGPSFSLVGDGDGDITTAATKDGNINKVTFTLNKATAVADGDMKVVTSDAVYDAIQTAKTEVGNASRTTVKAAANSPITVTPTTEGAAEYTVGFDADAAATALAEKSTLNYKAGSSLANAVTLKTGLNFQESTDTAVATGNLNLSSAADGAINIGLNKTLTNLMSVGGASGSGKLTFGASNTLDANGGRLTKLANGSADDDAATVGQIPTLAKGTPLSYKANDGATNTVTLEKGLNFTNGKNTSASTNTNGTVTFSVADNLTGITSIGLATGTTTGAKMTFAADSISLSSGNKGEKAGGVVLHGLADGTELTDAATVGQLSKGLPTVVAGDYATVTSETKQKDGVNYKEYKVAVNKADLVTDLGSNFAKVDASNISSDNATKWRTALDVYSKAGTDAAIKTARTTVTTTTNSGLFVIQSVGNPDTHNAYTIAIDEPNLRKIANIEYTANSNTSKQVTTLANGFNFLDGTNTTASVDAAGKVKYNVKPDLTGIKSITGDGNKVTLGATGINVGSQKITGVAAGGTDDTDAVNFGQLKAVKDVVESTTIGNEALNTKISALDGTIQLGGNSGVTDQVSIKDDINFTIKGDAAGDITTTAANQGVTLKLNKTTSVTNADDKDKVVTSGGVYTAVTGAKTKVALDAADTSGILTVAKTSETTDLTANSYTLGINKANLKTAMASELGTTFAKVDASNIGKNMTSGGDTNAATWRTALDVYSKDEAATKTEVNNGRTTVALKAGETALVLTDGGDATKHAYELGLNATKVASAVSLSYKADGESGVKTTTLSDGLTFKGDSNVKVATQTGGVVQYTLNSALTGIASITGSNNSKIDLSTTGSANFGGMSLDNIKESNNTTSAATVGQLETLKSTVTNNNTTINNAVNDLKDNKVALFGDDKATTNKTNAQPLSSQSLSFSIKGNDDIVTTTTDSGVSLALNKITDAKDITASATRPVSGQAVYSAVTGAKTEVKTDGLLKLTSTTGTGLEKDVYTVSLSADDIKNALGVTSDGKLSGNISYRANKSDSSASVALEKGLDFTNGANTVASVAADGVVTFDLKDTLTGIKSISNVKSGVGTTLTLSSTANEVNVNGAKVKGVADGEAATDAVNKGQLDKLAQRIGTGTTGTNGTAGPAGKDGLDGANGKPPQSLTEKVNALRNGTAGNMVYTAADANGVQERLVMEGGEFYRAAAIDTDAYAKAIDGKWYRKGAMDPNTGIPNPEAQPVAFADVFKAKSDKNAVATENVNISAVNANGKVTDATPLLNIASALGILPSAAVDASNAKALGGEAITATAAKSVVGSAADKMSIYSAKGAALTQGVTLADLQAVAQAGLDFTGNSIENSKAVAVHAPINSTVKIEGKSTYDANTYDKGDNISTKVDAANKQILITMKKKPSFDSVTVGKTGKQVTLGTDEEGNLHLSDKEGTSPNDKVILNGLKDGMTADSAVTKGALDALKAQIGGNGATGATGAQGNVGPAGKDGLNGHSLTDKVEGLRDGLAGNMVYTNSAGDRLVKGADGYYKVDDLTAKNLKQANNGLWYPKANVKTDGNLVDGVAESSGLTTAAAITANGLANKKVTDVQISTVNADGSTTKPTVLRNVDSTLSLKKAGNVPTTADEAWADKFVNGGNNGDTNKTANDAKGLLGLTGSVLTNGATLGELQAVAQSGIDFKGDTTKIASGTYVHAPIGSTVDIVGGGYTQTDYNSNKYTSDNLATYVDAANKQIRIMMKTNPTFATATLGSGENAVTLTPGKKADGTTTLTLKDGKAEPNNKVVLTGLAPDNTDRNSAVTLGQLLDRTASLGNDGVDGANGSVGPAGKDGLNGQSLGTQINNLRTGTAGNMVYTIDKGDNDKTQVRLLTDGTKFVREDKVIEYTQVDGKWYHKNDVPGGVLKANAKVVPLTEVLAGLNAEDVSKINISSVNANGKVTKATPLMNIAGALGEDAGDLQDKTGAALNQAVTVGDLKLVANQGITFGGNQMVGGKQKTIAVGLGKTLSVKGAATDYTPTGFGGENLYTTVDDYTINIKMKKSPVFTGVTVGETGKQVDITTDKDGNLKLTDKENTDGSDKVVLTGLKDGTTPDSAVTKGALDALKASITGGRDGANGINGTPGTGIAGINGEKGHDGKDGIDGALGKVGPSGKDGLAGHNIYDKIEAQREGLSGNMVYTDGEGNRVVKVEGVYYKASAFDNFKQAADGKWYPKAAVDADGKVTDPSAVGKDIKDLALENGDSYVPVNQVVISTVNPIGETTEPTAIGNVKSNLASATLDSANDNPVGTASEVATKAMIGLGDADGATDLERKGLLGVTDKDVLNHAATVGDLQTVARAGMTFQTNDKPAGVANTAPQTIHKALGETLTIIGKEDAQYRTLEQLTATLTSKYAAELTPKLKAEGRSDEYIQKEITKAVTEAATSAMRNGTTYSANNLVTTVTADGKIQIAMADSPTFKAATVGDAALTFIKDPVHKLGYVQVSYRDGGEPGTGVDGVIVQGLRTSSDPTSAATKGYVDNKLNGSAVVTAPDVINSPSSGDHFEQSGMGIQVLALRNGVSGPVVYTSKTGERAMRITQVSFADDGKLQIGDNINVKLSALDNYKLATNASGAPMGWYKAGADIWKEELVSNGKGGTITTKTNQLKDNLTKEQLEKWALKLTDEDIIKDKVVLSLVSDTGLTKSDNGSSPMALHNVDSGLDMISETEDNKNKTTVQKLLAAPSKELYYAANLEDLKALAEAGMDFTANAGNLGTDKNGATVHRNLGEALQIIGATGGDWNKFDTKNIMTYAEDGVIKVGMAKAPTFEGLSLQGINGKDGEDGKPGQTITLTPSADGKTITIQGPKGEDGKDGKVVIDGLTTGGDNSAATKEYVDKKIKGLNGTNGTNGLNGSGTGTAGQNGPAGEDGLNGQPLGAQVLAGRDGLSGTMVYTDGAGNRLVRDGNTFYTADSMKDLVKVGDKFYDKANVPDVTKVKEGNDGKLYNVTDLNDDGTLKNPDTKPVAAESTKNPTKVDPANAIISAANAKDGSTKTPTAIGNVKSAIGLDGFKQAVDKDGKALTDEKGNPIMEANGPIGEEVAQIAVAGDAKDGNGGLLAAKGATLNRVATVGDLQAVAQAGLDFGTNIEGTDGTIHRALGTKLDIKGADANKSWDAFSDTNLMTKLDGGVLRIGMKKSPVFESIVIGGDPITGKAGKDGVTLGNDGKGNLTVNNNVVLTGDKNGALFNVTDGKTTKGIKIGDTITFDEYLKVVKGSTATGSDTGNTGTSGNTGSTGDTGSATTDKSAGTVNVDTTGLVKQSDFTNLDKRVDEIGNKIEKLETLDLSKLQPNGTIGTGQESDLQAVSGETVRDYLDKNYTNNAVLNQRLTKLSKQANAGTASAMAAAAIPQVTNMYDDNLMIGAGTGVYGGESAVAIGVSGTNDNRDRTYRISTTYDSTGKWGLSAGIGFSIGSGKNTPKPSVARALSERVDRLEAENKALRETNQTEIKDLAAKNDQLQKQVQELQAMLQQLVPQVQAAKAANATTQTKTADEDAEQPAALAPATR